MPAYLICMRMSYSFLVVVVHLELIAVCVVRNVTKAVASNLKLLWLPAVFFEL